METNKSNKVKIDIWIDFMCPLCYIGKTNLEKALNEFSDQVETILHPFQLFPDASSNTGKNYYDYTSMTHGGLSTDYIRKENKKVIDLALSVGLNYDLDRLIPTNTGDALRILLYAQEQDKAKAMDWASLVYRAYLIEGLDIGNAQTLAKFGNDAGLNTKEILEILNSDRYSNQIISERAFAQSLGVSGVPFFIINDQYGISGVQTKEEFLTIIAKAWKKKNMVKQLKITKGQSCSPNGGCD